MDEGVAELEEKTRRDRPEAVVMVGKSIWESVWRVRHKRKIQKEEFRYGWQDEGENFGVVNDRDEKWLVRGYLWPDYFWASCWHETS